MFQSVSLQLCGLSRQSIPSQIVSPLLKDKVKFWVFLPKSTLYGKAKRVLHGQAYCQLQYTEGLL